jgi:hypothetical protein
VSIKVGRLRWLVANLVLLAALPALAAAYDSGAMTPWAEASISGVVFNDLDGDGKHDGFEPGLEGWDIFRGSGSDVLWEIGGTGRGGLYHISGLSPGHYAIRPFHRDLPGVNLETEPYFTGPAGFWREVDLKEGESKRNVDFGLREVRDSTVFFGRAWLDGKLAPNDSELEALVDGKLCARSHTQKEHFAISVRSDCGQQGQRVEFILAGEEVDWVRTWRDVGPGTADYQPVRLPGTRKPVYLGAGKPFAVLFGSVHAYDIDRAPGSLEGLPIRALIGERVCGEDAISVGQLAGYEMVVPSASLKPGCGVEGASVTFQVGDRLANESVGWLPGFQSQQVTIGEPPPPTPAPPPPTPAPTPEPSPGLWTRTPTPSVEPTPSPRPSPTPTATPAPRPR